ncbi:MAG: MarR family transcriptional regulator [Candidatus Methanoliparum thermophilum]|uniref:MarR family transcriptional regulator n=1 Tax=Methanoliparum thermophilum TaxID=2491083 RepID=A0A520KT88_METT2|nr:helix-turn-helix domain-containing protein [Candidatus Methanoliparum sp. LAM-1]RZN65192.1 MAG: MarR family transcriptional regulator [Candidatus Methanoliparum thermophilum]BDC36624.1 transcriptional regulator [Candidatus Methanoliparum sp. LAM-1]
MKEDLIRSKILFEINDKGEILQKDIAKNLKISEARCSKILIQLEKEGLIARRWIRTEKSRGYLIEPVTRSIFDPLFSEDGRIAVCIGCVVDCNPSYCASLNIWIKNLPNS